MFCPQEKVTKVVPVVAADETKEDFSVNRKRQLTTRVKVRKKEKTEKIEKTETKQVEDPKRQKVELKGPRVKHVCRSASIVLGQPIATFPTQEEKEKQEKITAMADESSVAIAIKDRETPDLANETDVDENKPQVVPEPITTESETPVEVKKRKIEVPIPLKVQNKGESSEDETIMDLVPRKTIFKPFTNITNVRFFYISSSFLE